MVVVYEVVESTTVRERAVEILDWYAIDGAHRVAPFKKRRAKVGSKKMFGSREERRGLTYWEAMGCGFVF